MSHSAVIVITPSHHKIVHLTEEYATLTRDDRARYEQILWGLLGEQRRVPEEFGFHVPVAMVLLGGGYRERAVSQVESCLAALRGGNMRSFLVLILIRHLTALGMFADANRLWVKIQAAGLPEQELIKSWYHAHDLALRSGSLELLHRCAESAVGPSDTSRLILDLLRRHNLLEWLPRQQRALEAVLGPLTTGFMTAVLTDDTGAKRIHMTYNTCVPTPDLRALRRRVFDALHDLYEAHPRGPAAFLGHMLIDVRGPYFAEVPPPDRERSELPPGELGTRTLWKQVRRFAAGRPVDAALRRNWAISRAYQAAVHHLMAAAPAVGIRLSALTPGGPYDQLIAGIVGSLNREWRYRGMGLELLRGAAIMADYSPGHAAAAIDVAEVLDLTAEILGESVEAEPEDATTCDAPVAKGATVVAPPAAAVQGPTAGSIPSPERLMQLFEAELARLKSDNPELERAMRRVMKLARASSTSKSLSVRS